ncbi:caspase family protein [Bacteroides sp.]
MRRKLYISTILMLFLFGLLQAQTKRALVIGLGEQEDTSWGKINGDKDVPLVKDMLTKAGYKSIYTLVNDKATKAGITTAFELLAQQCRIGDIVYIHFSGHGQQMTDREGDEKDGWDECWIPYDAYKTYCDNDKGEKHLTDDEINILLTDIRKKIGSTGKILVVVDACHSGDSSRGNDDDGIVRGVYDKFEIPMNEKPEAIIPAIEQWIILSACKSYQLNSEMRTPAVGKLTYGLYSIFSSDIPKDNEDLHKKLVRFMIEHQGRLPQTPMMTGETRKYNITDILK